MPLLWDSKQNDEADNTECDFYKIEFPWLYFKVFLKIIKTTYFGLNRVFNCKENGIILVLSLFWGI